MDGISLLPLLKGIKQLDRNEISWHYPLYGNQYRGAGSAIHCNKYKLIEFFEDGHLELYGIEKDIGDNYNWIDTYSGIADSMYEKLKRWRLAVDERYPTPNPDN